MVISKNPTKSLANYNTPSWLVTAVGLGLGFVSFAYLIMHPEPLLVWLLESILVIAPVTVIVYSGYWIATDPLLDNKDRWIITAWVVIGATIGAAFAVGFLLSVKLDGEVVNDLGLHALVGTLNGSSIALVTVISALRRQSGNFTASSDEDQIISSNTETPSQATSHRGETVDGVFQSKFAMLLKRAAEIYQREGIRSLTASLYRFNRRKLANMGLVHRKPYHERIRSDSTDRWEMIAPYLTTDDTSALDIGCASGFFTDRLARRGAVSIGIDVKRERLQTAKQTWGEKEGIGFVLYHLNPDNIASLPSVDVILLLTVYHHWCESFGRERAQRMVREVAIKSNKLFFEGPGSTDKRFPLVGERAIRDDESTEEYYSSLLASMFDDRVEIEYLGEAEYPHSDSRSDYLFMIDCRDYTSGPEET